MRKAGIVYFTSKGKEVAEQVKAAMTDDGYQVYIRDKEKDENLSKWTENAFSECSIVVFVSATGIAVRTIAPFLKSKVTDPGIISIDDNGKFIIPLVSGHLGGANEMAEKLADAVGGVAVVTTATDVNGKIAIDSWAKKNNLVIENMQAARECAMRILEGKPVAMTGKMPLKIMTDGIELVGESNSQMVYGKSSEKSEFGINVSWETGRVFSRELKLVPKGLVLGVGCRRGTKKETIERVCRKVLQDNGISFSAISTVATIDLKKDEEGLKEFSREHGFEFRVFTAKELAAAEGEFPKSEFVSKITGVDNVCQRAAVAACTEGEVLIEKTAMDGVTIAVAVPGYLKEDLLYVK